MVLLHFGEVGLGSSLDMVFKVVADLVYMSTLRVFIRIYWEIAIGVLFSFLVVHLLKFLPTLLSVLSKPLKSRFKRSLILQRAWLNGIPKLYASKGIFSFYGGYYHFGVETFHTFYTVTLFEELRRIARRLNNLGFADYAAGSVGSFISNPADNIVASLYNKKADSFILAVKKIGIINLFTRSLSIRIMLVGPVVTLQWPTGGEVTSEVGVA